MTPSRAIKVQTAVYIVADQQAGQPGAGVALSFKYLPAKFHLFKSPVFEIAP